MSSIETQVLPIIVSIIVAISLHIARGIFDETKEIYSILKSHEYDSFVKLTSFVLHEMQNDVERCLFIPVPPETLGVEYHAHRRCDTAQDITIMIWDERKKQKDLENVFNSWSNCEQGGQFICNIGTFLNLLILVCLLVMRNQIFSATDEEIESSVCRQNMNE